MDDGYEFFADRKLVTIFSAPNYCNEFDNDGAMLAVDEDLNCSFVKLTPKEKMLMYNKNSFKNTCFCWQLFFGVGSMRTSNANPIVDVEQSVVN